MKDQLINHFINKEGVHQIIDIFDKKNIILRFVGGCVRNALLNIENYDIDFAINCHPEQTIAVLNENNIKYDNYGKKYGLIVAIINNKKFELTSLREDINQKGRDTDVKYTNDWRKDASRRDFTMNAIYLTTSGQVHDYFDGYDDLLNQQVRFIGEIEQRVQEDYLRILRFYRFLGCFKKINILDNYEAILCKYIPNIKKHVKYETIRSEILKMLKNPYKENSLQDFHHPYQTNDLIKKIKEWWIEDNYQLGLQKCMNQVMDIFNN